MFPYQHLSSVYGSFNLASDHVSISVSPKIKIEPILKTMNTVDSAELVYTAVKHATTQNSSRENGFQTPLIFYTVLNIQENRQKQALSKKSNTKEVQGPDNSIQKK